LVGIINYIKPNSPASETVLKRGDIFLTINGTQLTIDNYLQLLDQTSAPHVLGIDNGNTIQSVSLKVIRYEENPVLLDTIYAMGNKKIAYLIYNFFASDKGDNSYTYSRELNAIFGKYKQENVDELILDLRYNGGGSVDVAIALAGMISNRTSTDLFSIDQYNSIVHEESLIQYGNNYNKTFFSDFLITNYDENGRIISQDTPIHKLTGLNRLYVLTSNHTASASELIINSLKPYMEVILIGETTVGKNVGMYLFYERDPVKQKDNRWGMLPIVVKIFNANNQSDYTYGFTPDIPADEYIALPWLPLGNMREFLLERALDHIGVQPLNNLRSNGKGFYLDPVISSFDRMPARRNLIVSIPAK
jgi:C-terminal processing protease CtpA/Prc